MRTCAVLVATLVTAPAWGHGGVPAIAELTTTTPCLRVDQEVTLRWTEPDAPSVFGPSRVQLAVTRTSTRPLYARERPLTPWTIVHEVLDSDPAPNTFVWRTATVTPGHYFVWSHMVEPPMEGLDFAAYQAPYVVTVERPGVPQGPTVMLIRPGSLGSAFGRYELTYAACDPTGTARVRLEAAPDDRPDDYRVIADDLPAVEAGAWTWDTIGLQRTRWIVRARIYDDCGHVFESHARAFIEVRDPVDPVDAGVDDARAADPIDARTGGGAACQGRPDAAPDPGADAAADAGVNDAGLRTDAGPAACVEDCASETGCGCGSTPARDPSVIALLVAGVYGLARRRRQGR